MKRILCTLLLACVLLSGCAGQEAEGPKQYNATFLTLFDTVTTIVGKAENADIFRQTAQQVHDELLQYHQLFDVYNDYDGLNNLKTVNDNAGIAPVEVDGRIIALLKDCKAYHEATFSKVNPAMGSVLLLWHEARNDGLDDPANAYLPKLERLEAAAQHMDFDAVVLNEESSTVFITDPDMRLDVGAVAKGWSVQQVSQTAPEGLLISVGGNVCATGPKDQQGTPWVVGVTDPDGGEEYLHTLYLSKGSVVTSGDYQRNYAVDGKLYHHIIDPDTLFPSDYWRSVTIVHEDSGLADALSTALFLLDQAEGQKLLDQFGAKALWVDMEGNLLYSPGFEDLIRN